MDDAEICAGGVLPRVVVERRVVDERMHSSELLRNLISQSIDGRLIGHVEAAHDHLMCISQAFSRLLTFLHISRSQHNRVIEIDKLSDHT